MTTPTFTMYTFQNVFLLIFDTKDVAVLLYGSEISGLISESINRLLL